MATSQGFTLSRSIVLGVGAPFATPAHFQRLIRGGNLPFQLGVVEDCADLLLLLLALRRSDAVDLGEVFRRRDPAACAHISLNLLGLGGAGDH